MQSDDMLLVQAADHAMSSLKRYLDEPNDCNRSELLTTCKHYNAQGVQITVKPDPAVIVRRLNA